MRSKFSAHGVKGTCKHGKILPDQQKIVYCFFCPLFLKLPDSTISFRMAAGLPLGNVGGGKYDAALMGILQDCVKLPVFMDTIFSFLARRTDFFIIMEPGDTQAKMGFLERESETMVLSVRYWKMWNLKYVFV